MDLASIIVKSANLVPKALSIAASAGKAISEQASYDFGIAHQNYCTTVIRKYCRARTFFVRNEPQYLDEFYVPSTISTTRDEQHSRADLSTLDKVTGRKTIITGTGGSGKTIFMRHLLLNSIETGAGYPVFIELRNLSEGDYSNIEGAVVQFMLDHGFPLTERYARKSIADGLLVIILDGFDEVPASQRKKLERSIKKMMSSSSSRIVISSRPDIILDGWDDFTTAKISPLSLEDACELLEKIRYEGEEETKQRFISSLRESLFESHGYFLSNPLLLSIMLLTYGDSADIPTKFASFYEQAFTALFQKHDALKSGYKRERKTQLDMYEFARLFSTFCAVTYRAKKIKFSPLLAISHMKQAKLVAGMPDISSEDFIDDAKQAACLLIEEGLDLTFVHRSFQEYFAARFINEANDSIRKPYFKEIISDWRSHSESVTLLLYEMNPHFVEENYLIPEINSIFAKNKARKVNQATWASFYLDTFRGVRCNSQGVTEYWIKNHKVFSLLLFMSRIIPRSSRNRDPEGAARLVEEFALHDCQLAKMSSRSPQLLALGKMKGEFGIDFLETLRKELLALEAKVAARHKAISKVFQF